MPVNVDARAVLVDLQKTEGASRVPPEVAGSGAADAAVLAWRGDVLASARLSETGGETTVTLYRIQPWCVVKQRNSVSTSFPLRAALLQRVRVPSR
jgi:hypothetical protein